MDSLTALKLNVNKVLELSVKQNEKLTDIQRKLELTSASITSLARRVDRIEENSRELTSASIASLASRVECIEGSSSSKSISMKVPREISVICNSTVFLCSLARQTLNGEQDGVRH